MSKSESPLPALILAAAVFYSCNFCGKDAKEVPPAEAEEVQQEKKKQEEREISSFPQAEIERDLAALHELIVKEDTPFEAIQASFEVVQTKLAPYAKYEDRIPAVAAAYAELTKMNQGVEVAAHRLPYAVERADAVAKSRPATAEGWKEAVDLYAQAAADLQLLVQSKHKSVSPKQAARLKKQIDKKHARAEKQYKRAKLKEEEAAAYVASCGLKPVGCGTGWNGACAGASIAFEQVANDPDSVEVSNCTQPYLSESKCWISVCTVRARNGFGALIATRYAFSFQGGMASVLGKAP